MKNTDSIAIVLDDHLLFADSFSALLEQLGLFSAVYTFGCNQELSRFLIRQPDANAYLFLDYYLQNGNGLRLMNDVRRLNKNAQIIVMSSVSSPIAVGNILDYNPQGFVSKTSGFNIILRCLEMIASGKQYLCPVIREIAENVRHESTALFTARELEILHYFAQGFSIADTAEKVFLSKHTIVAHRRKMMSKVEVKSITGLLSYARNHELI